MKQKIFLICFLSFVLQHAFTADSFAFSSQGSTETLHWDALVKNETYVLKDGLHLVYLGKNDSLPRGSKIKLINSYSLSPVEVMLYEFQIQNCSPTEATLKTDVQVVNKIYGAELETGCILNLYVELKDYYSASFLSNARMVK